MLSSGRGVSSFAREWLVFCVDLGGTAEAQDLVSFQTSVAPAMLLELEQRFIALPSRHTRPLGARWSSTLIGHWIRDLRAAGSGSVNQ